MVGIYHRRITSVSFIKFHAQRSNGQPLRLGEEYYDTTGHWYKSHGLTNADWTALN